MSQLSTSHAVWLAALASVVGFLSCWGYCATRRMMRLAARQVRMQWVVLSRVALAYAVLSIAVATVASGLLIMEHAGMDQAAASLVEFLSRFEKDLVC